ncbi:MAG: TetR/AcrR family transcriptional regulator [Desulfobacterales bacterium]
MDRKTAIIDAATRLFAEKGFAETSTAEIAETAGVAHGTLFYHFKNKQGILREIFSRSGSTYLEELRRTIEDCDTGLGKIEAAIRFNNEYSIHNSQQIIIFLRVFPDQIRDPLSSERNMLESVRAQVVDIIKQSLAAGVKDGTIECDNIEETAWVINSLIFGITHMDLIQTADMPVLTGNAVEFCRRALKARM